MFQPTLDHIKQLIGNVLNEPSLKGNSTPLSQRINNVSQELRQGGSCPDQDDLQNLAGTSLCKDTSLVKF